MESLNKKYENLLKEKCWNKINELQLPSAYVDRLLYESDILFDKKNMAEYIFIVYDYVNYCHKNNIAIGYGRGSSVGSLVLYLLDINKIDPIKFNLSFERFSMGHNADIDIDVDSNRREEVVDYILNKYKEHAYRLYTINKNGTKQLNPSGIIVDFNKSYEYINIDGIKCVNKDNYKDYPKFDILSSRNIGLYENILRKYNITINFNDQKVWEFMWNNPDNLFLLGGEVKKYIKDFKPNSIEELCNLLALVRSPEGVKTYTERRDGKWFKKNQYYKFVKDTYGIITYQEQLLNIISQFFKLEDAYTLMKDKNKIHKQLVINMSRKHNCKWLYQLYDMNKYLYNKSHGIAYAHMSYINAYLQYYYPEEFKEENVVETQNTFKYKKLTLDSKFKTEIIDDIIICGFDKIKGLGETTYNELKIVDKKKILNFLYNMNKNIAEQLIRLGIFDELLQISSVDLFNMYLENKGIKNRVTYIDEEREYKKLYENWKNN